MLLAISILLAMAAPAHAKNEVPGWVDKAKAQKFLASKKNCLMAVGRVRPDERVDSKIYCVTDMVIGQGTINEHSGCTLSLYDMDRDRYLGVPSGMSSGDSLITAKKDCADGGFKELLGRRAFLYEPAHQDKENVWFTVSDVLSNTEGAEESVFLFEVISGYKAMLNAAKNRSKR